MRVVGAKIVPELVGHDIEVPAVVVQVVHRRRAQVRTEASRVRRVTIDAEISDAARSGIRAPCQQVRDVARAVGQVGIFEPLEAKRIQHRSSVAGESRVRIRGFPNVDV